MLDRWLGLNPEPPLFSVNMYWSKYNILSRSNKYGYLLYNTMSQVFIRIPSEEIELWMKLKDEPDTFGDCPQSEFLLKSRIVVEDAEDDLNMYLADVSKNRYNTSDMALTILPTRVCNFGCIYCYEQDRPNIMMSRDTEQSILRFVRSNVNVRRLSVVWYGGEPLMNFSSIVRLSENIMNSGLEYSARMVTNGYLLNKEVAERLESLSIRHIQVTLDGPEPIHNVRRPLLGGHKTYHRIMNNLKYLLEVDRTITIDIRTNIDTRNKEFYSEFYKGFKEEISSERVNLYPGFVSDLLASECVSPEYNISSGGYKARFALDVFNEYGIEIKSFMPRYRRHSCVASKYLAFVIGPEGEIYKCWRMVGDKQQEIGNVNLGGVNMVKFSKYISGVDYTRDPICLNCKYIALCGGGCPLIRMRNKYENCRMDHCCPEKNNMDELMEMRYEMTLKSR